MDHKPPAWCERLYQAKAAELILYGRALGLGHSEAEDVVQETFLALLQRAAPPEEPERYCVRSFRNRALNHRRSFWRRMTRELEARRWSERTPEESHATRTSARTSAGTHANIHVKRAVDIGKGQQRPPAWTPTRSNSS